MAEGLKLLGSRVDALTISARVRLDPKLVDKLRKENERANRHGRVAFSWASEEPDTPMGPSTARRLGPHRLRWIDDHDRVRRVNRLWGELRRSDRRGTWIITNAPYFRLQIREHGPGAPEELRDCAICCGGGMRAVAPVSTSVFALKNGLLPTKLDVCSSCGGSGRERIPGFTVEIVWYAQELARSGLEVCLRESEALAALCGEVEELRLNRIDLCADVEGWTVEESDARIVAKRARADLAIDDGRAANDADDVDEAGKVREGRLRPPSCGPRCRDGCICRNVRVHATGGMQRRRITGISVGSGGAVMSRIYNKRVELERDTSDTGAQRRADEEERWRAAGWDGDSPVARIEFQLRGPALVELGIRDPDTCLVPLFKTERYKDRKGVERVRMRVAGHKILTVQTESGARQATLVDRLEAVWRTCLEWVRLVVPEVSRNGKPISVSRLKDDPRWELLRTATFGPVPALPIKRYRPRASASAAMALGVSLSQAGRDGRLREDLSEDRETYEHDPNAEAKLRARVLALKAYEATLIVADLVRRHGGVAGACEHFAIRQNAARAKFRGGVTDVHVAARPPPYAETRPMRNVA